MPANHDVSLTNDTDYGVGNVVQATSFNFTLKKNKGVTRSSGSMDFELGTLKHKISNGFSAKSESVISVGGEIAKVGLAGQVLKSGGVSNATVQATNKDDMEYAGKDVTDTDGNYEIIVEGGKKYAIQAYYDDGETLYNAENEPFIDTSSIYTE